jgi:hypothetical protein
VAGEHLETIREGDASFNRGDTSWARESHGGRGMGATGAFPGTRLDRSIQLLLWNSYLARLDAL